MRYKATYRRGERRYGRYEQEWGVKDTVKDAMVVDYGTSRSTAEFQAERRNKVPIPQSTKLQRQIRSSLSDLQRESRFLDSEAVDLATISGAEALAPLVTQAADALEQAISLLMQAQKALLPLVERDEAAMAAYAERVQRGEAEPLLES